MQVALRREVHHLAVTPTRHDHRTFGGQGQHFFQHAGHAVQLGPGSGQRGAGADAHLAFAVVAHAGGFEDAGQQIVGHRGQLLGGVDHGVGRTGHTTADEVGLFSGTVLGNGHGGSSRCHGAERGQQRECRRGHVFKFRGDGAAQVAQTGQAIRVHVVGVDMVVAHAAGGAGCVRVQHGGEVAHALGGVHKHAPQLAAADHTQRGFARAGQDGRGGWAGSGVGAHGAGGSVMPRASSVCWARKVSSCVRRRGLSNASMATANNAALAAPAVPMANVATGMPLGI